MDELKSARLKRERGISNTEFYEDVKETILNADLSIVITVKDGVSTLEHTGGDSLVMSGALSHAQFVVTHNSIHWEE